MVAINLKERFRNGELDLSSCGLKEIPKDITTLKNIISLDLSNNKIASVGKFLGNLTYLQKLNLSRNHIKGLSANIGNLTNLKYLDLSNNQIATLPATIGNLKNLKLLDLKNNPLAQKFAEIVGSCQNERQCQQAAKNVLKVFSTNIDGDKKKKYTDKEFKKNKYDKKTQNGGIYQQKQKDFKNKKSNKGVFGKILETILAFIRTLFVSILIFGISFYMLSFYDENRYKTLKSAAYPHLHSALNQVLTPEQTAQVEARFTMVANQINKVVVNTGNLVIDVVVTKSKQLYTYVSTDETIQKYANTTKTYVLDLWVKVSNSFSADQKQKS